MSETGPHPKGHSKGKIARGLAWVGLASSLVGTLDVIAQIILLHLFISTEEYGVAGLALALFPVLDQATDLGLSAAVIQRDDHSPDIISTVFWLNLLMSLVLFGLLAGLAPIYARWQGHPIVGWMLIAYGGKLILQNVYAMPSAMMRRELRFKELSVIRVLANVAEFLGKVGFGAFGYHIWCFVFGPLLRTFVTGVGVQLRHPFLPRLRFKFREASAYFRFGINTSASQILFFLYTNLDYAVVNKLFGATALGLYKAAYELVLEPVRTIATVFVDVAFPTFARLRTRRAQLAEQLIAFTRQNLVVILPFVAFILVAAEEALSVFAGARYAVAATAARVLCVVGMLRAMSSVVPPLLDGIGMPWLTLIYNVVASLVLPGLFVASGLVLGPQLGYFSVAVAWAAGYPVAFFVIFWIALRQIGLSPTTYLRRIIGIPLCAALAMGPGELAAVLAAGLPAAPRFFLVAAVMAVGFFILLAYLQGISPRTIARAIRQPKDEL